ncbi:MAG: hypothetical protein KC656_12360 [Myxococcales bacterium]|nr:hypothetical protein [Myxococcales bacterium]
MTLLLGLALAAERPELDVPTVLAVSAATYVSAAVLHEGLGHGGGCLLAGGRFTAFSLAVVDCQDTGPGGARFEAGAGVLGGTVGALATGIPLVLGGDDLGGTSRYALWLHTLVNMQQVGGYMMVGPWVGVGDWSDQGVFAGVRRPLPGKIAASATGLAITLASVPLANALGRPLWEGDLGRKRALTWTPWLVGSSLITFSALANRAGPEFAVSAGVANFAGTLFLAYLPLFFNTPPFDPAAPHSGVPQPVRRSRAWWIAGGLVAVGAVAVLAPGVGRFPEPHPLVP